MRRNLDLIKRRFRSQRSGQMLIITSLIIIMLLLSTAIYISETEKNTSLFEADASNAFPTYRMGARHTVLSSLVSVSGGENSIVLAANLDRFKSAIADHAYRAIVKMDCVPLNATPYQDGVWISWGSDGKGVSSAYVSFAVNSTGSAASYYSEYAVNVTTAVAVQGNYTLLADTLKQADVTCTFLNEGKPALAQNLTVYFEDDGSLLAENWVQVVSPNVTDYGDGTYRVSFAAATVSRDNPLLVSVHTYDLRDVFVMANVTCTQN